MFAEIGNFALNSGLIVDLLILAGMIYGHDASSLYRRCWIVMATGIAFCLQAAAMISLIICHLKSDMSVLNVVLHSSVDKPTIYKIAGAWGSHEGSMLLWNAYLAFFVLIMSLTLKKNRLYVIAIGIQVAFCAYFTVIALFTKPFARIFPPTSRGMGMNAVLQDVGLALHPPLLYLGYVGCSALFAIAAACGFSILFGFGNDKLGSSTVRIKEISAYIRTAMRPWALFSWGFLTIGITLGSWWAYREVGWGGYWFWDPVENASFLPWVALTGLLHGLKGGSMRNVVVFGMMPFILSVGGTFLVRSGLISSVHSFASDSTRALIVLYLLVVMLVCLVSIWLRMTLSNNSSIYNGKSYSSSQSQVTICISMILFITLFGTIYPLAFESFYDHSISVGSRYFNYYVNPIFLLMACLAMFVHWKMLVSEIVYTADTTTLRKKHIFLSLGIITFSLIILVFYWQKHGWVQWLIDPYIQLLSSSGIIISISSLMILLAYGSCYGYRKWNASSKSEWIIKIDSEQAKARPLMFIAHATFVITVFAISACSYGSIERQQALCIGCSMEINGVTIVLQDIEHMVGPNYLSKIAKIMVYNKTARYEHGGSSDKSGGEHPIARVNPELRFFPTEKQMTVESDIMHSAFYDLHVSTSEIGNNPELLVRAYYRPMISWLWFAGIITGACGIMQSIFTFYRHYQITTSYTSSRF